MKLRLDYKSPLPMYEQIKEGIKENIYNGNLMVDEILPSVRQLAKDLEVSNITTKRAYNDLEIEGFIYTISGKGTFVSQYDRGELLIGLEKKLLETFENQVRELHSNGIEVGKLMNVIHQIYKGE